MRKAVFLDRDGVINRALISNKKPYPPSNISELEILPGVPQALTELKNSGYILIVVTNQPDVARGKVQREVVEKINTILMKQLPLDAIKVCYHDDCEQCLCRKPLPGLLLEAAKEFAIDLEKSFMIGDRWKDILAGKSAKCKTFFINNHYDEHIPEFPDFIVSSLLDAQKIIIGEFK